MTRAAVVVALVVGACSSPSSTSTSSSPSPPPSRGTVASSPRARTGATAGDGRNVTAADYIGPDACGECHPAQLAAWRSSSHRAMNARASEPGAVIGRFDGAPVRYRGGELRMARDAAGYTMTARRGDREVRYLITRTIGHRALQEYVGVEEPVGGRPGSGDRAVAGGPPGSGDRAVGGGEPRSGDRATAGVEVRLPFGWWPAAGGWAPQPAFDPWLDEAAFDPFAPVREPWAERCPWCHSTYPFEQRLARAAGPREVGHGLERMFAGAPPDGDVVRLAVEAQVTTGISCESCHLGGRAHAAGAPIQFLPRGVPTREDAPAMPGTFAAQRKDAAVVNAVCAQCHSGPSPRLADGTALRNSSEALDLLRSPCRGIRCIDCHDPHRADGAPDPARVTAACAGCHGAQAARSHAGTGHAEVGCVDCHMPRVVMGIDRFVRTHRISSPTDARLIAEVAPNACNLCHLDRSIGWTLVELRAGWDVALDVSTARYGDDDASVGDLWLSSGSPAIRLLAAHAYARSPLGRYARAAIGRGLTDPLPYVRAWSRLAIDALDARGR